MVESASCYNAVEKGHRASYRKMKNISVTRRNVREHSRNVWRETIDYTWFSSPSAGPGTRGKPLRNVLEILKF